MKYMAITCLDFKKLDFTPTIVIGFYRSDKKENFIKVCAKLQKRFDGIDIIGCSTESNLYNKTPHIDTTGDHLCSFLCLDMSTEAYEITVLPIEDELTLSMRDESDYGAVLLSSSHSSNIEQTISNLQSIIGENSFYGAIASVSDPKEKAEVYHNGVFYDSHLLLWFIDQKRYTLRGISAHHFQPVGFPLLVTESLDNTIYKIDNRPALDVLEEIVGPITQDVIDTFDHPFFLKSKKHTAFEKAPLCSIESVNTEERSISMFRHITPLNKLKVGISLDADRKREQLEQFHEFDQDGGVALLFNCVGIKANLQYLESLYLMDFKKTLKIPFIGFHSFGEIGPTGRDHCSVLHNQTISLAVISEKG